MKRILTILFLCAVCWNVGAFNFDEKNEFDFDEKNEGVYIGNSYLVKFFQCVYDKSPEFVKKHVDGIHSCIKYYHNTTKISESILYYMCDFDAKKEGVLATCFSEATLTSGPEPIKSTEIEEFKNAVNNCLFS